MGQVLFFFFFCPFDLFPVFWLLILVVLDITSWLPVQEELAFGGVMFEGAA